MFKDDIWECMTNKNNMWTRKSYIIIHTMSSDQQSLLVGFFDLANLVCEV